MSDRSRAHEFVGRSVELATFGRALDAARAGMPSVLLIGGDAGIGKSTLVAEGARRGDVALYLGRCLHLGGDVIPLAPLVDLLRQVRRTSPDAFADTPELAALAQVTTPEGVPDEIPLRSGSVFTPVLDLVSRLASGDAVVVGFEDLHWADAVTWDLFEYLARNLVDEHIVLVGTYRANEIGLDFARRRRLAELTRLPACHRLHLAGLGREEVAARVSRMIGEAAPASLVDDVLARGQGNPFFTEELVAAHLSGEKIPAVLSDLIATDLDGLDVATRRVLGVIAAVGRGTDHEMLQDVADLDEHTVEAAVRTALDAQLIVIDRDTDAYRFRHALIGEVVYRDLLPPERKRLHRRIADALADQPPITLSRAHSAGELAFHLDLAGDRPAAFLALLAAADAAETVAPAAALRHLERAFEIWDDVGPAAEEVDRGPRLWQAAELATGTAGNDRAVELARTAFEFGPPPQGEAYGYERLGRYLWSSGHLSESSEAFERAAELLSADPRGTGGAVASAGLAQAELMLRHDDSAERWCRRVFDQIPSAADEPLAWVMARRVLGVTRCNAGHPDEGVALCREAIAAAPSAHTRALATVYLGLALSDAGADTDTVALALDAVAEGRLAGLDRSFGGYLDSLAADSLTRLGRWPEAAAVLARHEAMDTLPVGVIRLGCSMARLAARRGDHDAARAHLDRARAQPVDPFHAAFIDWTAAEVHLALGDAALAAEAAERGWESSPSTAVLWAARFAMWGAAAAVELALDALARKEPTDVAGTVDRQRARLDAIRAAIDATGSRPVAVDLEAHLADAAASLTRLTAPDPDAWALAATRWSQRPDPWMRARARLREAEAAAATGAGDRAADALREAHHTATELDAQPLVADVEAVSRRTRLSLDAPTVAVLDQPSLSHLGLTPRETEVLSLVAAGRTNRQIGETLFVSEKTASVHVSNILRKLGVSTRVDAAAVAQRLGTA